MAYVYITEQGAILRKTGDRLIVQKEDEVLLDVPCDKVDAVLIFGNVQFTTQAVHEILQHGIELAILTRTGRLKGQITSPATKNIELRLDQFKRYMDEAFRLDFSRLVVSGKVLNCANVMRAFSYNHPETELTRVADELKALVAEVDSAAAIDVLMGKEGIAARTYFGAFGRMILSDFVFEGRKKHPAPDPVNALLSFGYTLVFNEIMSLLDGLGFDPYLGYFHAPEYGRASLASDLVEEFRASVDRFTLHLLNNRIVRPDDFYRNPNSEGMYLTRDALKTYFGHYETYLNRPFVHPDTRETTTLRKCFRLQAEKLGNHIRGTVEYTTFNLEV
jgi:CRISP-associated protein Cas1